jgi:SEFIR domain
MDKIFISYAHDDEAHRLFILNYSDSLINPGGLDCWIDRYAEGAIIPEGWPHWMRKKISEANFVLVVCSPIYHARFNRDPSQDGKGLGAKFETTLIESDIYHNETLNTKFIPIVTKKEHLPYIPDILKTQTHYNLSDPASNEALYRKLTNQPLVTRPSQSSKIDLSKVNSLQIFTGSTATKIKDIDKEEYKEIIKMKAGTKILQTYLSKPLTARFAIAKELGLLNNGESVDSVDADKISAEIIVRAYNNNLLDKLWTILFDEKIDPNPFKK